MDYFSHLLFYLLGYSDRCELRSGDQGKPGKPGHRNVGRGDRDLINKHLMNKNHWPHRTNLELVTIVYLLFAERRPLRLVLLLEHLVAPFESLVLLLEPRDFLVAPLYLR